MIIQLPDMFNFCKNGRLIAWVEKEGKDKVLKILPQYDNNGNQYISFRSIMTELTYVLKGRNICSYCGKEFDDAHMSVDHLYPFSLGGPTIPENLVPACKKHNSEKESLTAEEYFKFRMLPVNERESFKNQMKREHEEKLKSGIEIVPRYFFTEESIGHIIVPFNMNASIHTASFRATVNYYKKYNRYKYPIILDRKKYLLDGFYVVLLARKNHNNNVSIIELENVDVVLD